MQSSILLITAFCLAGPDPTPATSTGTTIVQVSATNGCGCSSPAPATCGACSSCGATKPSFFERLRSWFTFSSSHSSCSSCGQVVQARYTPTPTYPRSTSSSPCGCGSATPVTTGCGGCGSVQAASTAPIVQPVPAMVTGLPSVLPAAAPAFTSTPTEAVPSRVEPKGSAKDLSAPY